MRRTLTALAVLGLCAAALPAIADDDHGWRDHRWHRHGPPRHAYGHKHEWDDGRCKYEYKAGRHGYKEEVKCRRPRGYVAAPPVVVWAPPPPLPVYAPYLPAPAPVYAVPVRSFEMPDGRYCREYQRTATIAGRPQQVYGTACLMPDGAWQIVSE